MALTLSREIGKAKPGPAEELAASLSRPDELPAPAPGVYHDIPERDYHRWACASNSRLSVLRRSPAHLQASLANPGDSDTPAKLLGRAIDFAILEPDTFASRYVAGPKGDRRTTAVRNAWMALEGQHGAEYVLSPDNHEVCLRVRDAVYANPHAAGLLAAGPRQLSLSWIDAETDTPVKARLDHHAAAVLSGVVVDVKSTKDASPDDFERSVYTYGYHRQAALYLQGAERNGLAAAHFCIIAAEKEPPFGVIVYRMDEDAIAAGHKQLRRAMKTYAECVRTGEWPGYPEVVRNIAIPDWAMRQIATEDEAAA